MNAKQFRTMFTILHNLGLSDLEEAGVITRDPQGGPDWVRFNNDLTTFVLKLPDDRLRHLVALVARVEAETA